MLVYAQEWSLASEFWSYTPPQKLVFPQQKKNPIENGMRTPTNEKKNSDPKIVFLLFRLFLSEILSRRCRLSQSDLLKKAEKNRQKLLRFIVFPAKNIGTILSRRSRLSRTSRAPCRLVWPRPIDCDREPEQAVKTFPIFWVQNRQKKVFYKLFPI